MEMDSIIDKTSFHQHTLLLVEDNEDDAFLMRSALKKASVENPLQIVSDGEEAMDYLRGVGKYEDRQQYPLPIAVFLDLNLPRKNGLEVLAWIRQQPVLKRLAVHVITASSRSADVVASADLTANSYIIKPSRMEQLIELLAAWKHLNQFLAFPGQPRD